MLSKAVVLVHGPSSGRPTQWMAQLGASILETFPAALLPVANRPLLLHALDTIEAAGISAVAIVSDEAIAPAVSAAVAEGRPSSGLRVELVDRPFGGDLRAALGCVKGFVSGEPFLLHFGDSLQKGGLRPLVSGEELGSGDARVLTSPEGPGLHSRLADASLRPRVQPLRPDCVESGAGEHAGVYALGGGVIDVAVDGSDGGSELEPVALVAALAKLGGNVKTLPTHGNWRLGHRIEGWLEGNRIALEGLESDSAAGALFDTDIQGNVAIHQTAEIRSSVIRGPAVIGPMARLIDAYVGPYSSVGAGVLIEGAEIEHSIIMPGASLRYLGGRLEASIIGPRARVFRDFRLPRALRLSVGEGAEVALV